MVRRLPKGSRRLWVKVIKIPSNLITFIVNEYFQSNLITFKVIEYFQRNQVPFNIIEYFQSDMITFEVIECFLPGTLRVVSLTNKLVIYVLMSIYKCLVVDVIENIYTSFR